MYCLHNFCKVYKIKPLFKKRKNRRQVQLQVHILIFLRTVFHAINFNRLLRKLQAVSFYHFNFYHFNGRSQMKSISKSVDLLS